MSKRDYIDFQNRTQPLGYLITIRTYGTWLHGEERGSIDRRHYNRYGTPDMPPNKKILEDEQNRLITRPVLLDRAQRKVVESAIREVCAFRRYVLRAVNARSNHVHSVVTAARKPEHVMNGFKAFATRKLRDEGLIGPNTRSWLGTAARLIFGRKKIWNEPSNMSSTARAMSRFVDPIQLGHDLAPPYGRASDTKNID